MTWLERSESEQGAREDSKEAGGDGWNGAEDAFGVVVLVVLLSGEVLEVEVVHHVEAGLVLPRHALGGAPVQLLGVGGSGAGHAFLYSRWSQLDGTDGHPGEEGPVAEQKSGANSQERPDRQEHQQDTRSRRG